MQKNQVVYVSSLETELQGETGRWRNKANNVLRGFGAIVCAAALVFSSLSNAAKNDLSADNKSDLLFNNSSTGEIAGWLMNGSTVTATSLMVRAGNWTVTHTANFNSGGTADVLLRNNADGTVVLWLMNGLGVTSGTTLLPPGSGWTVSHTGDFNGDGKADILLRHDDGRIVLWLMDGSNILSGTSLLSANTGYAAVHVADFNGDGKADILLRNTLDGTVVLWTMNGGTILAGATILPANSGYTPTHTGDFNGDGKADILWRNNANGSIVVWLMSGSLVTAGAALIGPGNWYVNQVADFNGDGKSDILLRQADGMLVSWLMNGTTVTSGATLFNATSTWAPAMTGDYNGDGKADIIMRSNDGTLVMWLMNGTSIIVGNTILGPSFWNVAPPAFEKVVEPTSPKADAARLMSQATFGATQAEIDRVYSIGAAAYLEEQFGVPQTFHLDTVRNDPKYPTAPYAVMMPSIWKQYFEGNDQLRQKVVSALSQIIVVSQQNNTVNDQPCGMAAYLDVLGRNAFGNFRNILKEVTLTPAMGEYLDMKQSAKADPVLNSVASENYARELLQLFSIGTAMLNQDGSIQFSGGKAVSTYSEATVQEFARALTGWTFAGQDQTKTWRWLYPDVPYPADTSVAGQAEKACVAFSSPMQPWTATYRSGDNKRDITGGAHDTGAKTLLTYPGSGARKQNLPAGQTPQQDLDDVIENVFNHPNVGPFIAEQLIQRLVTSNPSGAYVSRVAGTFNNNGAGVRGDMRAVLKAILLDAEARATTANQPASYGKLREPIQRFTHFHRAFGAKRINGYYDIYDLGSSDSLGQSPLRAPSVFNYYHPDFAPSGPLVTAGLVGPEFEITNSATISGFMDFSKYAILNGFGQYESDQTKWIRPDYGPYITLAANPAQLVDALNLLLLSGSMSNEFRAQLIDVMTKLTDSNATTQNTERVKTALFLILNSPEYSIQK